MARLDGRIAGGLYLIYLGIRLILAKSEQLELAHAEGRAGANPFLFGLGVTLTNPKAIVLFASVFATAMTANTPGWLMAVMVGLVTASAFAWYSFVSLCMSSAPVIRAFGGARHWIERVAGVLLRGDRRPHSRRQPQPDRHISAVDATVPLST